MGRLSFLRKLSPIRVPSPPTSLVSLPGTPPKRKKPQKDLCNHLLCAACVITHAGESGTYFPGAPHTVWSCCLCHGTNFDRTEPPGEGAAPLRCSNSKPTPTGRKSLLPQDLLTSRPHVQFPGRDRCGHRRCNGCPNSRDFLYDLAIWTCCHCDASHGRKPQLEYDDRVCGALPGRDMKTKGLTEVLGPKGQKKISGDDMPRGCGS